MCDPEVKYTMIAHVPSDFRAVRDNPDLGADLLLLATYPRIRFCSWTIQVILEIFNSVFKFAKAFANASHKFRDLIGAEENKYDKSNEKNFLHADSAEK